MKITRRASYRPNFPSPILALITCSRTHPREFFLGGCVRGTRRLPCPKTRKSRDRCFCPPGYWAGAGAHYLRGFILRWGNFLKSKSKQLSFHSMEKWFGSSLSFRGFETGAEDSGASDVIMWHTKRTRHPGKKITNFILNYHLKVQTVLISLWVINC